MYKAFSPELRMLFVFPIVIINFFQDLVRIASVDLSFYLQIYQVNSSHRANLSRRRNPRFSSTWCGSSRLSSASDGQLKHRAVDNKRKTKDARLLLVLLQCQRSPLPDKAWLHGILII